MEKELQAFPDLFRKYLGSKKPSGNTLVDLA
jgi:hypothetical protein